jgi:hypothetical protein
MHGSGALVDARGLDEPALRGVQDRQSGQRIDGEVVIGLLEQGERVGELTQEATLPAPIASSRRWPDRPMASLPSRDGRRDSLGDSV